MFSITLEQCLTVLERYNPSIWPLQIIFKREGMKIEY